MLVYLQLKMALLIFFSHSRSKTDDRTDENTNGRTDLLTNEATDSTLLQLNFSS